MSQITERLAISGYDNDTLSTVIIDLGGRCNSCDVDGKNEKGNTCVWCDGTKIYITESGEELIKFLKIYKQREDGILDNVE